MGYIGVREIISLSLLGILLVSTVVYKIWRKSHAKVVNDQIQRDIEEDAAAYRRELERNDALEDDFGVNDGYGDNELDTEKTEE